MKNLSWLLYKGYYDGFAYWHNIKPSDEQTKKLINTFFKNKNKNFTEARLVDFKNVTIPNIANSTFELHTVYPGLLMGSGYTHGIGAIGEFKIGFQLDYSTGLPILPGSSIKGVLRSVFPLIKVDSTTNELVFAGDNERERARERVKAKWIIALIEKIELPDFLSKTIQPKSEDVDDKILILHTLIAEIFEGVRDITKENSNEKYYSIYNRNIFFDAIPIVSNHRGFLYGDDSITPHANPLRNPVPLLFLKVLPQITYQFNFKLEASAVEFKLNKDNLMLLFQKILLTIGLGAKTNVGYGQFKP